MLKRNSLRKKVRHKDIAPDEIFLDSKNLPQFDTSQFEGRLEKSIPKKTIIGVALFCIIVALVFSGRLWHLQISQGEELRERSENNNLKNIIQFAERGIIYDRRGVELVWNTLNNEGSDFSRREYLSAKGFSHLLGFVNYPKKDNLGKYYEYEISGEDGVEKSFDERIGGRNGLKIIESDVFGETLSESAVQKSEDGEDVILSIDHRVQEKLYELIEEVAHEAKFQGGAGVIMDVHSGELLAVVSFPEFSSQVISDGKNLDKIEEYRKDNRKPFLNRAVSGLYTPGSIIKPFIALAALDEGVISPEKKILSTGELVVPNPYDPENESVYRDWKAHGWVDMREAIAVSSNVYFYTVGGGFEDQDGLGITKIEKHLKEFGFGGITGVDLGEESQGLVPNPRWKKEVFDDDWRVGDTYITAIGQFGFQTTPIQIAQGVAMIANGGNLLKPTVLKEVEPAVKEIVRISASDFEIVKEGMRKGVIEGTATPLNFPYLKIAAKTGTAEVGALKESVNSWIVGFWPYEEPRYAFAVVLEKRQSLNPVGGLLVMTRLLDWMHQNTPEYLTSVESS